MRFVRIVLQGQLEGVLCASGPSWVTLPPTEFCAEAKVAFKALGSLNYKVPLAPDPIFATQPQTFSLHSHNSHPLSSHTELMATPKPCILLCAFLPLHCSSENLCSSTSSDNSLYLAIHVEYLKSTYIHLKPFF